jgi:hypothetical protein
LFFFQLQYQSEVILVDLKKGCANSSAVSADSLLCQCSGLIESQVAKSKTVEEVQKEPAFSASTFNHSHLPSANCILASFDRISAAGLTSHQVREEWRQEVERSLKKINQLGSANGIIARHFLCA